MKETSQSIDFRRLLCIEKKILQLEWRAGTWYQKNDSMVGSDVFFSKKYTNITATCFDRE